MKREEEVAIAIAKREQEIMEAVCNREAEVDADAACVQCEELIKEEVDERIQWVLTRENELKVEEIQLEEVKSELEESAEEVQQQNAPTTTMAKGSLASTIRAFIFIHRLLCM